MTVLAGESLFNDATALTVLRSRWRPSPEPDSRSSQGWGAAERETLSRNSTPWRRHPTYPHVALRRK